MPRCIGIMTNIYNASVEAAERYGLGYDLVAGANIAGLPEGRRRYDVPGHFLI